MAVSFGSPPTFPPFADPPVEATDTVDGIGSNVKFENASNAFFLSFDGPIAMDLDAMDSPMDETE
jgi:hypothetical protein